ncbi:hypothetical protein ACLOJK_000060 [Asimina triloba]
MDPDLTLPEAPPITGSHDRDDERLPLSSSARSATATSPSSAARRRPEHRPPTHLRWPAARRPFRPIQHLRTSRQQPIRCRTHLHRRMARPRSPHTAGVSSHPPSASRRQRATPGQHLRPNPTTNGNRLMKANHPSKQQRNGNTQTNLRSEHVPSSTVRPSDDRRSITVGDRPITIPRASDAPSNSQHHPTLSSINGPPI